MELACTFWADEKLTEPKNINLGKWWEIAQALSETLYMYDNPDNLASGRR